MMVMDEVEGPIEKLQDGSVNERQQAAKKLGELKGTKAVEPLIGALKDGDADVRMCAVNALGEIKDERAVEPLIVALKDDDSFVQILAAFALSDIGGERAVGLLIETLKDKDPIICLWAIGALVRIGEPAVKSLVEFARTTENWHLRGTISEILKKINEEAKEKPHDFGCREKEILETPRTPDEFKKIILDGKPVKEDAERKQTRVKA